ncbi:MAG: hypothetical protein M1829_006854 [Trizodia sp. TS-e1964]|nr:MAG: hypothetical protein M1829_006854 [Trizodia sp. TS-e1964]
MNYSIQSKSFALNSLTARPKLDGDIVPGGDNEEPLEEPSLRARKDKKRGKAKRRERGFGGRQAFSAATVDSSFYLCTYGPSEQGDGDSDGEISSAGFADEMEVDGGSKRSSSNGKSSSSELSGGNNNKNSGSGSGNGSSRGSASASENSADLDSEGRGARSGESVDGGGHVEGEIESKTKDNDKIEADRSDKEWRRRPAQQKRYSYSTR